MITNALSAGSIVSEDEVRVVSDLVHIPKNVREP